MADLLNIFALFLQIATLLFLLEFILVKVVSDSLQTQFKVVVLYFELSKFFFQLYWVSADSVGWSRHVFDFVLKNLDFAYLLIVDTLQL